MSQRKEPDVARLYHVHSGYIKSRPSNTMLDPDRRPLCFRTYPGSDRVDLPGRDFNLGIALGDVLHQRKSIREFVLRPLELAVLGRLLYASYGLRGYRRMGGQWSYDRPLPSAGGLYPLELYVATQAVEGLRDGVYHYDARAHQLELRRMGSVHSDLVEITLGQGMIRDANLVIMISAVFQRTMWKYGQRGYRFVWLDAGHLGQNLYLVAGALGLGPFAIGGFLDAEVNDLLDLPFSEEEVIYLVCVGQPKEERDAEH